MVKHLPTVQETWVQSLGWEDLLEKEMATHSSILAWKIPRLEEPGRLQSMGSQRAGHNWAISLSLLSFIVVGKLGLKQDLKAVYRYILRFPFENSRLLANSISRDSSPNLFFSPLRANSCLCLSLFSALVQCRLLINIFSHPRNGHWYLLSCFFFF